MLARQAGIRPTGLATAIYSHRNCDAARHLYRVIAGLESMIVGEAEIQGQVKRAYEAALALETAGPLTNHLFKAALATGKRVRTETAIGERQLSLPAVAVALAREQLGELAGREVVIIGTGETSELAARALADSGATHGVRRQPPARPRDQPRAPLRRYERCASTSSRRRCEGRHRRRRDCVAAPAARGPRAGRGDAPARRPADAADRPRGPARHRRRLRRARRHLARTTSTTCRRWPTATARSARPRRARPRGSSRRRSSSSRPGSGRSRCCRRWPPCARTRVEIAEQVRARERRQVGDGVAA